MDNLEPEPTKLTIKIPPYKEDEEEEIKSDEEIGLGKKKFITQKKIICCSCIIFKYIINKLSPISKNIDNKT
jgi:hypothetical protein